MIMMKFKKVLNPGIWLIIIFLCVSSNTVSAMDVSRRCQLRKQLDFNGGNAYRYRQIIHRIKKSLSLEHIQSVILAKKAFSNPQRYRNVILDNIKIQPLERYDGESVAYVFLTGKCSLNCDICFFRRPIVQLKEPSMLFLTDEDVTKLLEFCKDSNIRVLSISGGEPFLELNRLLRIIEEAESDELTLITSGFWAKDYAQAEKIVNDLYIAYKKRLKKGKIILRVSVDSSHLREITMQPILNLIDIFRNKFKHEDNFKLAIKSIISDSSTVDLINRLPVTNREEVLGNIEARQEKVVVALEDDYGFVIMYKALYYTNPMINLNDEASVKRNTFIYDNFYVRKHNYNIGVIRSVSGKKGLMFNVGYNGDLSVHATSSPDNIGNLRDTEFKDPVKRILDDVISLHCIEKGQLAREAIINEVNPRAVIRTKAINLVDYEAYLMLQEEKTRLYLNIRILQDYIQEGRISPAELEAWPKEIRRLVSLDKQTLIRLYHESDYSIVDQYLADPHISVKRLVQLHALIMMGHYDVTPAKMEERVEATNLLTSEQKREFFDAITRSIRAHGLHRKFSSNL